MSASWISVTGGTIRAKDGAQEPLLQFGFSFPDAFAGNVTFYGIVSPADPAVAAGLDAAIAFTGSPIAMPAVPGAGNSTIWGLQVNTTTGAVTLKSNTGTTGNVATPTADANNIMLFVHTITNGDTVTWLRAPTITDLN